MKRSLLSLFLTVFLIVLASTAVSAYEHDPRLNPRAMEDIVVDPSAVYGFSPSPDGSLSTYVDFDWTDPELVNGENGRLARIAYHESIGDMYVMLDDLAAEGCTKEEIARAVSDRRNEIRLAAYDGDEEGLAAAKARNLEKYGHEEGPLPDELYEKYGSWEEVIWKAFSANPGMDACLGLYDDYYPLYIASGMIDEEDETPASREYAAAVLAEAFGLRAGEASLDGFADTDTVSPWYAASLNAAVSSGVLRGYEDGSIRPGQPVTLVEASVMLARCLAVTGTVAEDVSNVEAAGAPAWAADEISLLSAAGLLPEPEDADWNAPLTVSGFRSLLSALSPAGTEPD